MVTCVSFIGFSGSTPWKGRKKNTLQKTRGIFDSVFYKHESRANLRADK